MLVTFIFTVSLTESASLNILVFLDIKICK